MADPKIISSLFFGSVLAARTWKTLLETLHSPWHVWESTSGEIHLFCNSFLILSGTKAIMNMLSRVSILILILYVFIITMGKETSSIYLDFALWPNFTLLCCSEREFNSWSKHILVCSTKNTPSLCNVMWYIPCMLWFIVKMSSSSSQGIHISIHITLYFSVYRSIVVEILF